VLVVVNQLTLEDQRYVRAIESKMKEFSTKTQGSAKKELVVIHNLKDTTKINDLEELIESDIEKGFGCTKSEMHHHEDRSMNHTYWKDCNDVTHCVIARHGSAAGTVYNHGTLALIRNQINAARIHINSRTRRSLLQGINQYIIEGLPSYFENLHEVKTEQILMYPKGTDDKIALYLDETCRRAKLRSNALVSEWRIIWGSKYELDFDVAVSNEKKQVFVLVDLPGLFMGEAPEAHEEPSGPAVKEYVWSEREGEVLRVRVQLATKGSQGACVEVFATRKKAMFDASFEFKHDCGKKGGVELKIEGDTLCYNYFADARVTLKENGTLEVLMSVEDTLPPGEKRKETSPEKPEKKRR